DRHDEAIQLLECQTRLTKQPIDRRQQQLGMRSSCLLVVTGKDERFIKDRHTLPRGCRLGCQYFHRLYHAAGKQYRHARTSVVCTGGTTGTHSSRMLKKVIPPASVQRGPLILPPFGEWPRLPSTARINDATKLARFSSHGMAPVLVPMRPSSEHILIVRAPGARDRHACHSIPFHRARSASKEGTLPLPLHPARPDRGRLHSTADSESSRETLPPRFPAPSHLPIKS